MVRVRAQASLPAFPTTNDGIILRTKEASSPAIGGNRMLGYCCWIDCHNPLINVSSKVHRIQCQNMRYSIHFHCCNQTSIVNLNPRNIIGDNQPTPFQVNPRTIGKEGKKSLNQAQKSIGISRSQPKSISLSGTCGNIPKFNTILRSNL